MKKKGMKTTIAVMSAIMMASVAMSPVIAMADEASPVVEAPVEEGIVDNGVVTGGFVDPEQNDEGVVNGGFETPDETTEGQTEGNVTGDLVPVEDESEVETPDENAGQTNVINYQNAEKNDSESYKLIRQESMNDTQYVEDGSYDLSQGKNYLHLTAADMLNDLSGNLVLKSDDETIVTTEGTNIIGLLPGTTTIRAYYYDVPVMVINYTVVQAQEANAIALMDKYDIVFLGNQITSQYRTEAEQADYDEVSQILFFDQTSESEVYDSLFNSVQTAMNKEQNYKEQYNFSADEVYNMFYTAARLNNGSSPLTYMLLASNFDYSFNTTETGEIEAVKVEENYPFVDQTDADRAAEAIANARNQAAAEQTTVQNAATADTTAPAAVQTTAATDTVELADEATPLAASADSVQVAAADTTVMTDLADEETPLAAAPAVQSQNHTTAAGAVAGVVVAGIAAGAVALTRRKKEQ